MSNITKIDPFGVQKCMQCMYLFLSFFCMLDLYEAIFRVNPIKQTCCPFNFKIAYYPVNDFLTFGFLTSDLFEKNTDCSFSDF